VERDVLSEKEANDCLLLSDLGRAQVEAARLRAVAYVLMNIITKC
jgi:hypothetical protein